MATKPVILFAALCLSATQFVACGDDGGENANNASIIDAGTDSGDDAGADDAGDAGPLVVDRTFVEMPPLNGLPTDNQVLSPEFEAVQNFAVFSRRQTLMLRQVYSETPYASGSLRLVAEGSELELLLWGVLRDGTNVASVWIGGDGDELAEDIAVELHGITIGDLSQPPSPVQLTQTDEIVRGNARVWRRYELAIDAPRGTFILRVASEGSKDVLVHAPIVLTE